MFANESTNTFPSDLDNTFVSNLANIFTNESAIIFTFNLFNMASIRLGRHLHQ